MDLRLPWGKMKLDPEFKNYGDMAEPAPAETVEALAKRLGLGMDFPYLVLLREADGFYLDDGTVLYPSAIVEERNTTYQVPRYAPHFLSIGDDSGGRAYTMRRTGDLAVYSVGMGDMLETSMRREADDLDGWLAQCLQNNIDEADQE